MACDLVSQATAVGLAAVRPVPLHYASSTRLNGLMATFTFPSHITAVEYFVARDLSTMLSETGGGASGGQNSESYIMPPLLTNIVLINPP